MLNFGNKEFRNLQEQVEKNKDDISQVKTGIVISRVLLSIDELTPFITEENVGKYFFISGVKNLYVISKRANDGLIAENLGDYPAYVPGPQGPVGPEGRRGKTGNSVYGVSTQLPDPAGYETGDFYLLANGNLYKKSLELQWVLQCSIRGPQGPVGTPGAEVFANPTSEATESILKIKIDGVTYRITAPTEEEKVLLGKLVQTIEIEEGGGTVTFGNNIYVDGNISTPSYVEANHLTVEDSSSIGGDLLVTGDVSANLLEAETTETDLITSDTTTSASQHVDFATFLSNDNYWHITNTKVDDTMYIYGTIELSQTGDFGDNFRDLIESISEDVLPQYGLPEAEKVLAVNSAGTGLEWVEGGGGQPAGTPKYAHFITLYSPTMGINSPKVVVLVINDDSTAYTKYDHNLQTWLYNHNYRNIDTRFRTVISAGFFDGFSYSSSQQLNFAIGIFASSASGSLTLATYGIVPEITLPETYTPGKISGLFQLKNVPSFTSKNCEIDTDKVIPLQ